ncbi:asparaginase [Halomonas cupida]|uniref:asparaginase n=1 Tax=Halomonas cupida TaxID=44933 RepID=UPI0039B3FE42
MLMTDEAPLLILYTGGTIGMVETDNGLAPGDDMEARVRRALATLPPQRQALLRPFEWRQTDQLIDSSSARPEDWSHLAGEIAACHRDYAGILVLHGTDTMAWTASSLAFQLQGVDRPVIITGSMQPLEATDSDALYNIETAMRFAAMPTLQEVVLCMDGQLLRGSRARKWHTTDRQAFTSPNFALLGERKGDDVVLFESRGLESRQRGAPRFELPDYTGLEERVVRIALWPGINAHRVAQWLDDPQVAAALIEVWGGGNIPEDIELAAVLGRAVGQGKLVVAISQCPYGTIKIGHYAAGQLLNDAGVMSGDDMTPEAAWTKLLHLVAQPLEYADRLQRFRASLVGERG